jgi:uncharacterized protein YwqG
MPKKHTLEFAATASPITVPVTKFGGQPVWIAEPEWPLSRETGKPMQFICQIALEELGFTTQAKMAYLFMTDDADGEFVDGTYEPDGGENAVILQPGSTKLPTSDLCEGPSLYRMVEKPGMERLQPEACEFRVELLPVDDIDFVPETERWKMSEEDAKAATGKLDENKIGGSPVFMQGDEFPFDGGWQLLLQLDSCSVPFSINFGDAGIGYAFLNETGDEGKFLWQCG